MDLCQNQNMCYIIYHSGWTPPKVLAMRIRCRKGWIVYHKSNGIMAMKNHVESNHAALMKIFVKDATFEFSKSPHYREPSEKRVNVSPFNIFGFFQVVLNSRKMTWCNQVLWKISCLLLKGCCLWRLWSPFGSSGTHVVSTSYLPIYKSICWENLAKFGQRDNKYICGSCIGWLLINHLYIWPLDV